MLTSEVYAAVHHPLNIKKAQHLHRAGVRAKKTFSGARGGDVLQLWRVVELTAATTNRRRAEQCTSSAAKHDDGDTKKKKKRGVNVKMC